MRELKRWFQKYFDKVENILLPVLILMFIIIMDNFGRILAPLLVSILLTYVLNSLAEFIVNKCKISRLFAIILIYVLIIGLLVTLIATLLPLVIDQLSLLIQQVPGFISHAQTYIQSLPGKYPNLISPVWVNKITDTSNFKMDNQQLTDVASRSLSSISRIVEWAIYVFVVPIITFLLLKDKQTLKAFYKRRLPVPQGIMLTVGSQTKQKLGGYIKGICFEAIISGAAYVILLLSCGLNYAVLLGIMSGAAVFIPVFGSLLMTIPIVILGVIQFGLTTPFIIMMVGYLVIHLLDAYLLAPYLFGKTLNLHPLAVLIALILFGGIFGFWGLVFAVPLATFIDILWVTYLNYGRTFEQE